MLYIIRPFSKRLEYDTGACVPKKKSLLGFVAVWVRFGKFLPIHAVRSVHEWMIVVSLVSHNHAGGREKTLGIVALSSPTAWCVLQAVLKAAPDSNSSVFFALKPLLDDGARETHHVAGQAASRISHQKPATKK
jgi:hypothetical protein